MLYLPRKVLTPWDGPQLIPAGRHLVSLISRCTEGLEICASAFVAHFLVLPNCTRPVILGIDFLQEYETVINAQELFVTFAVCVHTDSNDADEHRRVALHVVDECVTLPPRSSIFVLAEGPQEQAGTGIAEGKVALLLGREVAIAPGIVEL